MYWPTCAGIFAQSLTDKDLNEIRSSLKKDASTQAIQNILTVDKNIKENGDKLLMKFGKEFDNMTQSLILCASDKVTVVLKLLLGHAHAERLGIATIQRCV